MERGFPFSYLSVKGVRPNSHHQHTAISLQDLASREKEGIVLRLCDRVSLARGSRLVTLDTVSYEERKEEE